MKGLLIFGSLLAVILAVMLAKRNREPTAVKLRHFFGFLLVLLCAAIFVTIIARGMPLLADLPGLILGLLFMAFGFVCWFLDRHP